MSTMASGSTSGSIGRASAADTRTATNRCQARRGFEARARTDCRARGGQVQHELDRGGPDHRLEERRGVRDHRDGAAVLAFRPRARPDARRAADRQPSDAARPECGPWPPAKAGAGCAENWRDAPGQTPSAAPISETLSVPRCILRSSSRRSRSCIWVKFICGKFAASNGSESSAFLLEKLSGLVGLHFERLSEIEKQQCGKCLRNVDGKEAYAYIGFTESRTGLWESFGKRSLPPD